MPMHDVFYQLDQLPTPRLEAMYNHASRNAHNGIGDETANAIIGIIDIIIWLRGSSITGDVGHYEFTDGNQWKA